MSQKKFFARTLQDEMEDLMSTGFETLEDYPIEELEAAIKAKKEEERVIKLLPVIAQNAPALTRLNKLRDTVIANKKEEEDGHPDADEHYIYEAAMELFYGEGYWEWLKAIRRQ